MGGWCWTHGWESIGRGHCSNNCKKPAVGHKKNAKAENKMGGNEKQDGSDNYHTEQKCQWKRRN